VRLLDRREGCRAGWLEQSQDRTADDDRFA